MPNVFLDIPVPAANGPGAAVDISSMGKTKSIVCGGVFAATVNLEISTDNAAAVWAPLATFHQSGNLTIDVAAHWIRANVTDHKSGSANVDIGASDAGSQFVMLPGDGSSVDISALPQFKTVIAVPGFAGNIEVSEDGVSWAQIWSMQIGGAQSRDVVGQFARVIGGQAVWMGGSNDGGGSGGETAFALLNFDWAGGTITSAKNLSMPTVVNVGIRDFVFGAMLDDPDRAVITCSAVPVIFDGDANTPLDIYAEIINAGAGLRVHVYDSSSGAHTNDLVRVFVRVDRVA